jgi:3-phenylpropionate/trans-cinnamate dioxygenase ferredoxin subunit
MSEFVSAGKAEEFQPGKMKVVKAATGEEVAVTKVEDGFYAFSNYCTHALHPMHFGYVKGKEAVCIFHWAIFDATNGNVIQGPAYEPLQTYEVRVENGDVQVGGRKSQD